MTSETESDVVDVIFICPCSWYLLPVLKSLNPQIAKKVAGFLDQIKSTASFFIRWCGNEAYYTIIKQLTYVYTGFDMYRVYSYRIFSYFWRQYRINMHVLVSWYGGSLKEAQSNR